MHVVDQDDVGRAAAADVGGKAAGLAALGGVDGVRVPDWICVTTAAYRRMLATAPTVRGQIDALAQVDPDGRDALAAQIRRGIETAGVPEDVAADISEAVRRLGAADAYAVRSSATAEDLASASFAGQHDSYLDVVGLPAVLEHISRCWASLFSDRAVAYRSGNGVDHRDVEMAVIVQRMVRPRASGVLFTADPTTGDRTVASVEAVAGLGDALVAGTTDADLYRVRDGAVVEAPAGATSVLTDREVLDLVAVGRRIESDLGSPQDVEWCIDDDGVQIVQSRPITTLFPIPEADDDRHHVYVSVGHGQMMTDPMMPLGISVWQLTSPAPMRVAGGRLFVDVTDRLASPATRGITLETLGRGDPRIRDALEAILARDDATAVDDPAAEAGAGPSVPPGAGVPPEPIATDAAVVAQLIEQNRASVARLQREIRTRSGSAVFELIRSDLDELRALMFDPQAHQAVMAGFEATWWLNDNLGEWLGEQNPADVLSLSAPGNVTAEMGLALLDVADVVRPHAEVVAFLRAVDSDDFLDDLEGVEPGGRRAREAIASYLDAYGVRCVGEIDIARPRWSERPSALLPMLLSNVDSFPPGERRRRVEEGERRARAKEQELLDRLRALPDGAEKAERTERTIRRLRTFVGYREYPKYGIVRRYFAYKEALLAEAERLVLDGVLRAVDDIFMLTFDELHAVVRTGRADHELVARRRDELRSYDRLTPPRVLTSDGEALHGAYRRDDLPSGALPGLAVSAGVAEGRARVVLDIGDAVIEPGDILVTPHTDPSWSPLFVSIAGLVTEVGGLTTHGSVVAREYGVVAVVGVDDATRRIRDGQRIRVDGTNGYVELIDDDRDRPVASTRSAPD